jgi:hypothetical protein
VCLPNSLEGVSKARKLDHSDIVDVHSVITHLCGTPSHTKVIGRSGQTLIGTHQRGSSSIRSPDAAVTIWPSVSTLTATYLRRDPTNPVLSQSSDPRKPGQSLRKLLEDGLMVLD